MGLTDPVAWGEVVGRHVLPLYMGLVLGVGLAAALAVRLLHPWMAARDDGVARLLPRMALGFLGIGAGVAVFAELAEELLAGPALAAFDEAVAQGIAQVLPLWALHVAAALTHAGDPHVLVALVLAVGAALLWRRRFTLAAGWFVAGAGNAVLNPWLKALFARARPIHDGGIAMAQGFSFPSGHSSGAVVVYGMLAYVLLRVVPERWRPALVGAAAALAVAVAGSRMLLRVHWASDVLAGIASGGAWLAVCVLSLELVRHHGARRA